MKMIMKKRYKFLWAIISHLVIVVSHGEKRNMKRLLFSIHFMFVHNAYDIMVEKHKETIHLFVIMIQTAYNINKT